MNQKLFALAILCLLSLSLMVSGQVNQPANLQPGAVAPEIVLEKILQAPAGTKTDWASLRGKVVILEFWATWCAPCIALQPHLNELAEKFKDQPVYFISISDEPEEIVAPFLQRRPLKGWIGLNQKHETFRAYGVSGIPRTIVVDQQGKIVTALQGTQQGMELSEAMLNQLIAKNSAAAPADKSKERVAAPKENSVSSFSPPLTSSSAGQPTATSEMKASSAGPAILDISIRPSKFKPAQGNPSRISSTPTTFSASGPNLSEILRSLMAVNYRTPFPITRMFIPADLQEQRFDVTAIVQNDKATRFKPLVVSALENALGIKIQRVTREIDVYVLTAPKELAGGLRPTKAESSRFSGGPGVMAAAATEINRLVDSIEGVLKIPVIDETKLQGKFDWDLVFDGKNPQSIIEAVRKEFGLELTLAKRPVEIVLVEKE